MVWAGIDRPFCNAAFLGIEPLFVAVLPLETAPTSSAPPPSRMCLLRLPVLGRQFCGLRLPLQAAATLAGYPQRRAAAHLKAFFCVT